MDSGIRIFNFDLQAMRDRPAMYLSPVSITAFRHFIIGYEAGRRWAAAEVENPFALPSDVHPWVAYRLHFYGEESGWANMLIERFGDGPQALEQFFKLLDEYHCRTPEIVATLSGLQRTYTEVCANGDRTRAYPSNIVLTSYNAEDPGLFVSAEGYDYFPGEGFCRGLSYFKLMFGACQSELTILDRAVYELWAGQ